MQATMESATTNSRRTRMINENQSVSGLVHCPHPYRCDLFCIVVTTIRGFLVVEDANIIPHVQNVFTIYGPYIVELASYK